MRLLILGGTVFLGRHVAADALARGHDVTLFHRGRHGADLFPDAAHLHGDRGGDLGALEGGRWDAAVDTSGYEPADVAASSRLLAQAGVEHLAFVSTCNVYPAWPAEPVSEDSPVWTEGDDYGPKKAACERAAEEALPGRVAAVRAGLLCGPHDNVFRLPWWVRPGAHGAAHRRPRPRRLDRRPRRAPPGRRVQRDRTGGTHDDGRGARRRGRGDRVRRAADLDRRRRPPRR